MKLDLPSLVVLSALFALSWRGQPSLAFALQSIPNFSSQRQLQRLVSTLHAVSNPQDNHNPGRRQQLWDQKMQELREYYIEFGTYNVSYTHFEKNDKWAGLARWLQDVRKRQSRVPKERLDQLFALGISLKGSKEQREDQQWDNMFDELVKFKNATGNTRVPKSVPKLGQWVNKQRQQWKKGTLKPDRKKKLESINFEVALRASNESRQSRYDEIWLEKFDNLIEFHEEHGHFWPSQRDENATIRSLGTWATRQRYLKKKGQLQAWRKEALDKVEFPWDYQEERDASWFSYYDKLKKFLEKRKKDGEVGIVWTDSVLGWKLYQWVTRQRLFKENGNLDPMRKKLLDEMGFEWEFLSDK